MEINKKYRVEWGFEPSTLWLTAIRSNQQSYSSIWIWVHMYILLFDIQQDWFLDGIHKWFDTICFQRWDPQG